MTTEQMQEDLQYIKSMIDNNRRRMVDSGIHYILAGLYVVVGTVITQILIHLERYSLINPVWMGLMAVLIAVNIYIGIKSNSTRKVKSFATQVFEVTWIGCGTAILLLALLHWTTGRLPMTAMLASVSAILGAAYLITGVINQMKLMKILAVGWWLGTVIVAFWDTMLPIEQMPLFFTALVFFFEVIPGTVLYLKWKKVYHGQ